MKPEVPMWIGGVLLWSGFVCMLAIFWPLLALAMFFVGMAVWAVGRREYVEPFERKGEAGRLQSDTEIDEQNREL